MKCLGGTCINKLSEGYCKCGKGEKFDHHQSRCLPNNCGIYDCGIVAVCRNTAFGADCDCAVGAVFNTADKSCECELKIFIIIQQFILLY